MPTGRKTRAATPWRLRAAPAKADQKEALYGLVSKAWIEARSRESTYHAPARDARLVIEIARSDEPPNLIQEVRHSLIYATLGSFTTNLPPEASSLLAQFGAEKEDEVALLLQDDQSRVEAQIAIGAGCWRAARVTSRARAATRDAGGPATAPQALAPRWPARELR